MHALTPDPAQVARLRADFERIAGRAPDNGSRLGLAVSGGPDSVALLLLAAAAWPRAVAAATVDHRLRPEARDEGEAVAALCARLGVPHDTLAASEPIESGNLQDRARALRYGLLADWAQANAIVWVAIAHQQDDIAEGLLMRARRGSGVGGLAAMRATRPLAAETMLVRPLLGWRRAELAAIVAAAGVSPASDPSNTDPRFDRSRIRALLAESTDLPADKLALAAANLRHAEDALAWIADCEWAARSAVDSTSVELDVAGLPYEVRRRLARRAVEHFAPAWQGAGIDGLVAMLDSGEPGTIAEVQARSVSGKWRFNPAPARRSH